MVAGEASGDLLASLLLRGLHARLDRVQAHGIGGHHMVAEGFRADWPSDTLAVRGYAEVLLHLPRLLLLRKRLGDQLIARPPQAFIGIDAPDFNLDLELRLRAAGVPVMHFVSPSIWAWRRERIEKIRRAVDHMLVLFPFEPKIYREAGIEATYVGHPLADEIALQPDRTAARAALGIAPYRRVVALLPGSRLAEVSYNGGAFLAAASLLAKRLPEIYFIAPMANAKAAAIFKRQAEKFGGLRVKVLDQRSHAALEACDATLVASGTATLEAALFKRPMVIAYRMAPLSYAIMKGKGYQPWVGLPNILAGEFLVPELLQDDATPEALALALQFQLEDNDNRAMLEERFTRIHLELRCDTAQKSAAAIASFLDKRPSR